MLIYFWVVLVISPAGFPEDLLGCAAICIICDSNHIVSMLKCMCSQNKGIHSFVRVKNVKKQAVVIGFLLLHCFIEQICSYCLSEYGLLLMLSTSRPTKT